MRFPAIFKYNPESESYEYLGCVDVNDSYYYKTLQIKQI